MFRASRVRVRAGAAGLGFRVEGLGFSGLGFRVSGLEAGGVSSASGKAGFDQGHLRVLLRGLRLP